MMIINNESFFDCIVGINEYDSPKSSFSPFMSNIGLGIYKDKPGVGELYLHYNRATRKVFDKLLSFNLKMNNASSSVNRVNFGNKGATAGIAFYKTDCFVFESNGLDEIGIFSKVSEDTAEIWEQHNELYNGTGLCLKGYSKNPDDRDPDRTVPFAISLKISKGTLIKNEDEYKITAEDNGEIFFALSFHHLTFSESDIINDLAAAPYNLETAEILAGNCLHEIISGLKLVFRNKKETAMLSRAILGLYQNLSAAKGSLNGKVSQFPNRGTYPTLFLWDTCFQNLAFEMLSPETAIDSLRGLVDNQRCDGKLGQFNCSTWQRPDFTQPALLGWAALRLIKKTGDLGFAKKILPALEKNNRWWLTSRITPSGLICCPHGLETGQDDSPRFDNGTTISVDMNSYLLNQMRCTAEIASILGKRNTEYIWSCEANKLASLMIRYLYDENDGFFYDVYPDTLEKVKIKCCSNILPLWAGVPLPEDKIKKIINDYLLSPSHFFGEIPFPSVGYSEEAYQPDAWWRGPTWLPIAWLMLETLKKYNKNKEYKIAAKRLYKMIAADGELHELFDSKTGAGLGSPEQGWTCAIFIALYNILF